MWLLAHVWGSTHRRVLINLDTVAEIDLMPGNSPPAFRVHFKREEARQHLDLAVTPDVEARLTVLGLPPEN